MTNHLDLAVKLKHHLRTGLRDLANPIRQILSATATAISGESRKVPEFVTCPHSIWRKNSTLATQIERASLSFNFLLSFFRKEEDLIRNWITGLNGGENSEQGYAVVWVNDVSESPGQCRFWDHLLCFDRHYDFISTSHPAVDAAFPNHELIGSRRKIEMNWGEWRSWNCGNCEVELGSVCSLGLGRRKRIILTRSYS